MPKVEIKRNLLFEIILVVVFVFVLATPQLIKGDIRLLPFLFKTLLVCISSFYVNLHLLLPRYLSRGKYLFYAIGVLVFMLVALLIMKALSPWSEFEVVPIPLEGNILPFEYLLPIVAMFFVSTLYGFYYRQLYGQKREIDLTHQNIEFEMKFLKSQINPHFLFNALNNIYALSVIKSARTPDMILKLSDMLRFTLYDSESKKVKLKREIEYINNFIDFQKLKADTDLNVKVEASNCNDEFMIEPMLLIPFIENSFKHGNIENPKRGWLKVEIKTLGPILIFKVANSLPSIAINKDVVGGIGVENVRKRLDILYPDRYELKITTTDADFSVFMKIDTCATDV